MILENKVYKIDEINGYGKSTWIYNYIDQSEDVISYQPQFEFLFNNISIEENAKYFLNDIEIKVFYSLIKELGFNKDTILIRNLSGGQKKKIELAITLSKNADIYIFDEPLNNLDFESKQKIKTYISSLNNPVIVVDHLDIIDYDIKLDIPKVKRKKHFNFTFDLKTLKIEIKDFKFNQKILLALLLLISLFTNVFIIKNGAIDYHKYNYVYTGDSCEYNDENIKGIIPIVDQSMLSPKYFNGPNTIVNIYNRYSLPLNIKSVYGYTIIESNIPNELMDNFMQDDSYYGVYKLLEGSWPKDYSNEIAITINMYKAFDVQTIPTVINFAGREYNIVGVFSNQVDSPQKVITSYKGNGLSGCEILQKDYFKINFIASMSYLIAYVIFNILIILLIYRVIYENVRHQINGILNHQFMYVYSQLIIVIYILFSIVYFNTP